jgi:2-iminobutanoate/2-iminopropanoate deaminase
VSAPKSVARGRQQLAESARLGSFAPHDVDTVTPLAAPYCSKQQEDEMMPTSRWAFDVATAIAVAVASVVVAGCAAPSANTGSMTEVVSSPDAPKAIGPYSQGIKTGNLLFLSAQGPFDAKSGQMSTGGIEEQTKLVMDNLTAVLAANEMTMANVVSTTVYMKDLNDFAKMNAVYGSYFKDKPPARGTVQVAGLPRGALIGVSAIASK